MTDSGLDALFHASEIKFGEHFILYLYLQPLSLLCGEIQKCLCRHGNRARFSRAPHVQVYISMQFLNLILFLHQRNRECFVSGTPPAPNIIPITQDPKH